MSAVAELLAELTQRGVTLEPRGDSLAYHPRSKVTAELRECLITHKREILRLLRGEIAENRAAASLTPNHHSPTATVPETPNYSAVILGPQASLIDATLLSLFAQPRPPAEILVCDRISRTLRKRLRAWSSRGVRIASTPVEAQQEHVLLIDGQTLPGRDWVISANKTLTERVGAVYSDHELATTGGRTNYPDAVNQDDLARAGLAAPTVLVRKSALEVAWQSGDSINRLLRRLARTGWEIRKQSVPVLLRAEKSTPTNSRHHDETITLFIPQAGREGLWREMRQFLERQTWPHQQIRLIFADTSQDPQYGRLVRDWISRCDYPDVRHWQFTAGPPGLADLPRCEKMRAVNQAMCRIYNRLRENLTTDFVWILEDDVLPPDHVLERLLQSFDEQTATVCAPYRSRFDGWYLVWSRERLGENGVHQLVKPLPDSPQVQAIRGSGFGCLVLRSEVLRDQIFHLPAGDQWYDVRFFRELPLRWKRFVDWSCACQHLHNVEKPDPTVTTRNLLYHVTPFASNDIWLRNVRQLVRRIELFNGRRIVAIATGEELVSPDAVRAAFGHHKFEMIPHPNSRELRENATFLKLLEQVASTDPTTATFYAHAKGVAKDVLCSGDPRGSRYWRNAMYHELLDDWERIAELLEDYPIVGTHRRYHPEQQQIYPDGQSASEWHFAGTFFWFRNRDVFATSKWREVWQPTGWGAEAWPGRMFAFDQSACVAYDGLVEHYHPDSYHPQIEDESPCLT